MKLILVSVFVAVAACGGSVSAPEDLGEACTDAGEAFCERAIECGLLAPGDRLSCINAFFAGCCADNGVCSEPVDSSVSGSDWNECLDAIAVERCADVEQGNVPAECLVL